MRAALRIRRGVWCEFRRKRPSFPARAAIRFLRARRDACRSAHNARPRTGSPPEGRGDLP